MKRWFSVAYLAVTLASAALAAVQPERVPEADMAEAVAGLLGP